MTSIKYYINAKWYGEAHLLDIQISRFQLCLFLHPRDWAIHVEFLRPFDTFPWWMFWWYFQIGPLWLAWD